MTDETVKSVINTLVDVFNTNQTTNGDDSKDRFC